MTTYKFLSDRTYPRADGSVYRPTMTAPDMLLALGIKGDHLPKEGLEPRMIQGIKVWVAPSEPPRNGRKSSKHRVLCACPGCGRTLSAGRLQQHACKMPLPRYRVACYVNHEMQQAATFIQFDVAIDQARAWYNRAARAALVEVFDLETGTREVTFGN